MQAPTVANEFFQLVLKSKLLSEAQLQQAVEMFDLDESRSARSIARRLVRERVLAPFQAERLLEGRYRGFVIDGYRVREVLGVGGMGCVYIAEDREHNRKVALKVLASQHNTDSGMLARMKLEARAGMEIDHPNVIRTYKIDSTGAVNYMVMELLRGISLHEYVALNGPMKWGMASDIFCQIAEGLQAAHNRQIIHRDIKPANILVAADGEAKLLDFGLAKLADGEGDEFSLAMIFGHDCLGTPDYIAPEQAEDSNNIDQTADIYSLGCTFYVALTGRVPFPQKKNSEKLAGHREGRYRPISDIRRDVPDGLIAIVEKMMARQPQDRFQTARELAAALKPFCKRRDVEFDFRELVTLRAKQARDRDRAQAQGQRRRSSTNSSITSTASWLNNSSQHLQSELDTMAGEDTPAIRQPDTRTRRTPSQTAGSRPAPAAAAPRAAVSRSVNVPRGWSLQLVKSGRTLPLARVKTRIGTSDECEIRMHGTIADNRQCTVEYENGRWVMRQESRKVPTFVNGRSESFKELGHGSVISFSDGNSLKLVSKDELDRAAERRNKLKAVGVIGGSLLVAAAAVWWLLFR